jgi:hypothetical protein
MDPSLHNLDSKLSHFQLNRIQGKKGIGGEVLCGKSSIKFHANFSHGAKADIERQRTRFGRDCRNNKTPIYQAVGFVEEFVRSVDESIGC